LIGSEFSSNSGTTPLLRPNQSSAEYGNLAPRLPSLLNRVYLCW